MKTITSVLGDKWVINNGHAKAEFSDIEFAVNENMTEVLNNAQKSEKWANLLRTISKAELNADQDAVYMVDKKNNNWFREISLEDPNFRVNHNDYFWGYDLVWPEDTRLKISEICGDPGSEYGPYLIQTKRNDGTLGIVGYSEQEEDIPAILESLKDTELNPLPDFFEHKNVVFDLPDGYQAEVNKSIFLDNGIPDVSFPTAIIAPDKSVVMVATMYPDTLIGIRTAEHLHKVLEDGASRRTNMHNDQLKEINDRLSTYHATDLYEPKNAFEFADTMLKLKKDTPLKVMTADKEHEILISWQQVKRWRHVNGKLIAQDEMPHVDDLKALGVDAVRLCVERVYTIQTKQTDGFLVIESRPTSINSDKLYSLVSDQDFLMSVITRQGENGTIHPVPAQEQIISTTMGGYQGIEYLSDKNLSIKAAIKMSQNEMDKAINKYGSGLDAA